MATEFDNSLHWGLFLTGTTLTSETGKYVRVSELVLSALRAAGVFSTMVDGVVAPATDKLWLDKNVDPAVLKEWDATGASWVPMSYDRLFGRAALDKLTVTGGTGNAVVVSQPPGFQASRLYLMTPTQNNSGAATITVSGVGSYGVKYGNGADIGATEFTAGRQAVLFFTGVRFEVVFPLSGLTSAVLAAQASASAAAASQVAAAGSQGAAAGSASLAQEFATQAEDVPITGFPALRSALHWAAKAAGYVAGNIGVAIHGFANKATFTDADELLIADSANSWNGKRQSWGQLKTNIGIADNLRLSALSASSIHVDANNMIESGWYFANGTSVANLPIAGGAGHGYIHVFQQSNTGPSAYATKQIYYEGAGHRTFTRYRWYSTGAWGGWVETTSVSAVRSDTSKRLDVGYTNLTVTPGVANTISSGTFTVDFTAGAFIMYGNGGAHTLALPAAGTTSDSSNVVLRLYNVTGAGLITISGASKVTGDPLTTTVGHNFYIYITRVVDAKHVHVVAMQ